MTDVKRVRTVPIAMLAELARLAANTMAASRRYYKTRDRQHLMEAKDYERRLEKSATGAIELFNTIPELFEEREAPRFEHRDVAEWLEREADYLTTFDPNNMPPGHVQEEAIGDAEILREAAEVLRPEEF